MKKVSGQTGITGISEAVQQAIVYVSMIITLIGLGLILSTYSHESTGKTLNRLVASIGAQECPSYVKDKIACTTDMDCELKASRLAHEFKCNYSQEI